MRGIPLYKDASLGSIKFEGILQEIEDKRLTGVMKLSYWDVEDSLYYLDGKPVDGLRRFSNGRREKINPGNYTPHNTKGVLSFYATSPLEVLSFKESLKDRITPYTFVTYGHELVAPIPLSHANPKGIFDDVHSLKANGYMVILQKWGFGYLIVMADGKPVCVFSSEGYMHHGKHKLEINPQESYIAVFRTEPEFANFLASLDTLKKVKTAKLNSLSDINGMLGLSGKSFLVELIPAYGLRLFYLFYGRSLILKAINDSGEFVSDIPNLSIEGGCTINLYTIDIRTELNPVELSFSSLDRQIEYVPRETLLAINRYFMEEIGLVGIIVWKKVFEKLGLEVDKLPKDKLSEFIRTLAQEIPDDRHSNRFLEKTRRWLS